MKCEDLQDYYELYALGVADEPEKSEIRQHLNRECEVCVAGMKKARTITAVLGGTAMAATPSPKLRRRILASVGVEEKGFGWAPFLAAAAVLSLCAAVYFGGREREFAEMATRLRDQLGQQTVELHRLNEAFAIVNGPETTMTSFGAGQPQPPKGRVFVNPSQGVLLMASNLPPAPAGKVYEMWVIPKGGKPRRAGEFRSQSDGTAIHVYRGTVDVSGTGAVAVTMENEGGANEPTMPIVAVAALQ
jgi:anti-sigma-K factor RskA